MLTIIRGPRASGKTTVAASLAAKFESQGNRIILIDEFDGHSGILLNLRQYMESGQYYPISRKLFSRLELGRLFGDYDKIIIVFKTGTDGIFEFPNNIPVWTYDLDSNRSA